MGAVWPHNVMWQPNKGCLPHLCEETEALSGHCPASHIFGLSRKAPVPHRTSNVRVHNELHDEFSAERWLIRSQLCPTLANMSELKQEVLYSYCTLQ